MKISTKKLVLIAVFAALSAALMFLETNIPIFPSFLKLDLSTVVVLISSYVVSPIAGIVVALIKDLIHLPFTKTGCIGELADFLISSAMVFTAAYVRKKIPSKENVSTVVGLATGTCFATIIAVLANYFLIIPFYETIMPLQAIIDMSAKVIPAIHDKFTLIMYAFLPFNIMKMLIISIITFILYKRMVKIPLFNLKNPSSKSSKVKQP